MKTITFFLITQILLTHSFAQTKGEELNDLLTTYNQLNTFNGAALVVHNGKLLLNQGYGFSNYSEQKKDYSTTIFQIGSITKQFTATVLMKLVDSNKIKLTDLISKYLPYYPDSGKITVYHLLTHTAGIFNYTDDVSFMQHKLETPVSKEEMLHLITSKPLEFEPGTKMKYCNSGYLILGYIIEAVTKKKYETVVREFIFEPLKMTNSGFDFKNLKNYQKAIGYETIRDENVKKTIVVDSTVSFAGGAIYSTTGDLLKWHHGLLNNKILNPKLKDVMFKPYLNDFGFGWVNDKFFDKRSVFHNGSIPGFTSNIYRIEEDNTCIILLNNIANKNIDTITKNLLCILYEKPYIKPQLKKEINFEFKDIEKYIGIYQFDENFKMRIFFKDKSLYAQRIGEEDKFELFLSEKDTFFMKAFEAEMVFSSNTNAIIDTLQLNQGGKTMKAKKIE